MDQALSGEEMDEVEIQKSDRARVGPDQFEVQSSIG
jgi:hypothetical protein